MKNHNYFSSKNISLKSIPRSYSIKNIKSSYLIPGKIHKKIKYSPKYSLDNFIPVNDTNNEIKIIGSGSFGNVYLAKNNIDNKIYAIKHMEKNKLLKLLHSLKGIYREIDFQSRIEHENIIRILYTYEDKESFNLVMEYAQSGNLFHYIRKNKGLSESHAFQLFIQVVNAVYFLHKNDLIHRDIKPENILLFNIDENNNSNNFLIKLCDFGWCVKLDGKSRKTFCGTTEYMSPELIEHKIYSKEIDVWSLGILLYEMIHGYSPFRPKKAKFDEKEVYDNIKRHHLKFGKNLSERCKKLIYNLLAFNKNKRYKVEDIYNSEFVKYYEKKNLYIPHININITKKETLERNKNKIIRSFSRIYKPKTNGCRNYIYKIKKSGNSFINKISNNICDITYTKSSSKRNDYNSKLNSKVNNNSFSKENNFSSSINNNKAIKNKRNKLINKINSNLHLNTEKIYLTKKNSYNIIEMNISNRPKSIINTSASQSSCYKIGKENEKNKCKNINKKEKDIEGNDTIKIDLPSENNIRNILKDFLFNKNNFIKRKSPEIKNLLFDTEINKTNDEKRNKQINILNNTSFRRYENFEEKNKEGNNEEFKIFNINVTKNKNKNRIKYIKEKITKSNSFNYSKLKKGKKIILTPNNESNSSYNKQRENINKTNQSILLNEKVKKNYYSQRNDQMLINKINNINYKNNNINNFYIINNTNINNIENNYINKKVILFENYLKKVKIEERKKEREESSEETEKSTTPKKNIDKIKINPIKLLNDFHKEYSLFGNYNNKK